jgi:glycosyltransferase involved in cell wall biosynthesis
VSFPGRVSENDLRDWYRAADVFVLPTIAYEGFGMVTVEALASGTPVVGTPVGATPELLEPLEPRLVAGGDDPPSLAAAIGDALGLADADFRSRCRDYAVRRFDWDGVMVGWEETLFNAVAGLPVSASCAG